MSDRAPHLTCRSLGLLPPASLLLFVTAAFLARANVAITGPAFGDESGHLIGAHAIVAGDRLYRDFIDAHGPTSFLVPWLYDLLFGWSHANGVRWMMVVLAGGATAAVALSPMLRRLPARLWATTLFLAPLASVWTVQGLSLVSYHTIGGCCAVVALASFGIPAVTGFPVGRSHAAIAGACGLLCCATAYSLVPSALLLAAGPMLAMSPDRRRLRSCAAAWGVGFVAAGVPVLAWLLLHGDLVGYVVFHFLSMQANYARYAPITLAGLFSSLVPSTAPNALVHALALAAMVAGVVSAVGLLAGRGVTITRMAGLAVLVVGVVLLDARGLVLFQDGAFVMAATALGALPLGALLGMVETEAGPALGLTILVGGLLGLVEHTARQATNTPWGMTRTEVLAFRGYDMNVDRKTPILRTLRAALRPGERMMALVYSPTIFLNAGVLPVRGFHEYLPWEADYARHPIAGRSRDLCVTLAADPPPVIWYDAWVVEGRWPPPSFIPCLTRVLADHYAADASNGQLFIRTDRAEQAHTGISFPSGKAIGFGPGAPPG